MDNSAPSSADVNPQAYSIPIDPALQALTEPAREATPQNPYAQYASALTSQKSEEPLTALSLSTETHDAPENATLPASGEAIASQIESEPPIPASPSEIPNGVADDQTALLPTVAEDAMFVENLPELSVPAVKTPPQSTEEALVTPAPEPERTPNDDISTAPLQGETSQKPDDEPDTNAAVESETPAIRIQSPQPSLQNGAPPEQAQSDRPLNVTDALVYLDKVKEQFKADEDVYNKFLDIMKDFKSHHIDTPGVIKRVSQLFDGHPSLIQGFNTFLPIGYRIECAIEGTHIGRITVTTPTGIMIRNDETHSWSTSTDKQGAGAFDTSSGAHPGSLSLPPPTSVIAPALLTPEQHLPPAMDYVSKVKNSCAAGTYQEFLRILEQWKEYSMVKRNTLMHSEEEDRQFTREILIKIKDLFEKDGRPDLVEEFRIFVPETSTEIFDEVLAMKEKKRKRAPEPGAPSTSGSSNKRKRRPVEREREKEPLPVKATSSAKKPMDTMMHVRPLHEDARSSHHSSSHHSSHRSHHPSHYLPQAPPPPPPPQQMALPPDDETQFFPLVKRHFARANGSDGSQAYGEFLKLVNCFTQGYIDTTTLLRDSMPFLGPIDGELMGRFREILGWDEERERDKLERDRADDEVDGWVVEGGSRSAQIGGVARRDLARQFGSYRKLPTSEHKAICSGRDEMCNEVLNDEWVSHPTWSAEDPGFTAHRKNPYEEALHRSEEERHEYDFHIDALSRTIIVLDPINAKISLLTNEEKPAFKLKANLGGAGKAIHYRVIKKIYGREAGLEVIQAIQDAPALAIPVVLHRLKKKEEEWKRAQKEWNKVWKASDAKNYQKSLDHQGIVFKANDKKATTTRAFMSQIEAARDEQRAERASFTDPLLARTRPKHQMEFVINDISVLQDALKLTFSFLDRTAGQIGYSDRKKIEGVLRAFVPLFFTLDVEAFNRAFAVLPDGDKEGETAEELNSGAGTEDSDVHGTQPNSSSKPLSKGSKKAVIGGGDLRKKLLKSEQAKSTNRKTRAQDSVTPGPSRPHSPANTMLIDDQPSGLITALTRKNSRQNIFFGNTNWYVLLRLLELLWSRLAKFKTLSASLAEEKDAASAAAAAAVATQEGAEDQATTAAPLRTHPAYFYEMMLQMCENLFDNTVEQTSFEEELRVIFGTKEAYPIFTVDKVIGSLLKQVQNILQDEKSQNLLEVLRKERSAGSYTVHELFKMRQDAEDIVGPDEPLFKIDWRTENKLTFELLGHNAALDNSEAITARWKAYIEAFTSSSATSLSSNARPAFLKKWLPATIATPEELNETTASHSGLQIKICLATYRMFFQGGTEEWLMRVAPLSKDEQTALDERLKRKQNRRQKWLEEASASASEPADADVAITGTEVTASS